MRDSVPASRLNPRTVAYRMTAHPRPSNHRDSGVNLTFAPQKRQGSKCQIQKLHCKHIFASGPYDSDIRKRSGRTGCEC